MTCALFGKLFIALIAKELYSAFCFLVLFKKTQIKNLSFSSFFCSICFRTPFLFYLKFFMAFVKVHGSQSVFMIFEVKLE